MQSPRPFLGAFKTTSFIGDHASHVRDDCDTGHFFKGHDLSSLKMLEEVDLYTKIHQGKTRQDPPRTYLATEA
jgi:hypothetical protein